MARDLYLIIQMPNGPAAVGAASRLRRSARTSAGAKFQMLTVKFLPMEIECEAIPGETLLDVALNHDIPIQHACGGMCSCTTCHVSVKEGANLLSDIEEDESERLEDATDARTPTSRLGCQARLRGNVIVEIMNLE